MSKLLYTTNSGNVSMMVNYHSKFHCTRITLKSSSMRYVQAAHSKFWTQELNIFAGPI